MEVEDGCVENGTAMKEAGRLRKIEREVMFRRQGARRSTGTKCDTMTSMLNPLEDRRGGGIET